MRPLAMELTPEGVRALNSYRATGSTDVHTLTELLRTEDALQKLAPQQAQLLLHLVEGYSTLELAEACGISLRTCVNRLQDLCLELYDTQFSNWVVYWRPRAKDWRHNTCPEAYLEQGVSYTVRGRKYR